MHKTLKMIATAPPDGEPEQGGPVNHGIMRAADIARHVAGRAARSAPLANRSIFRRRPSRAARGRRMRGALGLARAGQPKQGGPMRHGVTRTADIAPDVAIRAARSAPLANRSIFRRRPSHPMNQPKRGGARVHGFRRPANLAPDARGRRAGRIARANGRVFGGAPRAARPMREAQHARAQPNGVRRAADGDGDPFDRLAVGVAGPKRRIIGGRPCAPIAGQFLPGRAARFERRRLGVGRVHFGGFTPRGARARCIVSGAPSRRQRRMRRVDVGCVDVGLDVRNGLHVGLGHARDSTAGGLWTIAPGAPGARRANGETARRRGGFDQ